MNQKLSTSRTIFLLLVAGVVIWWLSSHDTGKDQPSDPATSTSLDSHAALSAADVAKRVGTIHNVLSADPPSDKNGNLFVVSVKQDSIFEGGNTSKDVLHTIDNHGGKTSYMGVQIHMVETLVDGYGKKTDVPILQLDLPRSDVEKFNYDNIVGWNILNMAQVSSLNPVSAQIVNQECTPGSSNVQYAAEFCLAAANADPAPSAGPTSR